METIDIIKDEKINPRTYYDEAYFEKDVYSGYTNGPAWSDLATLLTHVFNPNKVLDIGCAKGFLVEELRKRGIEAFGCDISEYALNVTVPWVRPYIFYSDVISGSGFKSDTFDLVVSFDTLEHIEEEFVMRALKNVVDVAKDKIVLIIDTEDKEHHDKSHVTMRERKWWLERLDSLGLIHEEYLEKVLTTFKMFRERTKELFVYSKAYFPRIKFNWNNLSFILNSDKDLEALWRSTIQKLRSE